MPLNMFLHHKKFIIELLNDQTKFSSVQSEARCILPIFQCQGTKVSIEGKT